MIKTARSPLTTADLDSFELHDEWLGWGYIGARKNAREAVATGEIEPWVNSDSLEVADAMVLFHANRLGWTRDEFFTWANSKLGRWTADVLIGSKLDAKTDGLVRQYMTLKGL